MKNKKVDIYMNGVHIETMKNRADAEAKVHMYMKQDRYEVEVEGYAIPKNGYPTYSIVER